MAAGDPWIQLALMALVIPLLAAMKGALRTVAVDELMPQWRGPLEEMELGVDDARAAGAISICVEFYRSLLTKRIRWRGIRYELCLVPAERTARILQNAA